MKPNKYTSLSADWNVNLETAQFSSPPKDSEPNQIVVFGYRVKDGAISASITPIAGQPDPNWGYELRECSILFRYNDRDHFYLTPRLRRQVKRAALHEVALEAVVRPAVHSRLSTSRLVRSSTTSLLSEKPSNTS